MFPDNQNIPNPDNLNQNNDSAQPTFNQTPQQPAQPATDQFQQPQQTAYSQLPPQLPPIQAQQQQPTQQSSFSPVQQIEYQETPVKKKPPNALLLTVGFIILLTIGVVIAMVLIGGKSKTVTPSLNSSVDNTAKSSQPADDSQDNSSLNAPQILDITAVVQDFYDNYLTALRANSQPEQRVKVLHAYVKNNQNLTPSYQAKLLKITSVNKDPLLFGQKFLPGNINYGDPVAKKGDVKTATLPVTIQFGSSKQTLNVTLTWQTAQNRAGIWQISSVTKK